MTLAKLSEIDVSIEGVKGAKNFFEAKVWCGTEEYEKTQLKLSYPAVAEFPFKFCCALARAFLWLSQHTRAV